MTDHARARPAMDADAARLSSDWCVVWTEARSEKRVAGRLAEAGIEQWLPTVTERRRWSDRWKNVVVPLFPSYLFVRAAEISRILGMPGVLTVVKDRGKPARLSHGFIQSLRSALECSGLPAVQVSEPPLFEPDAEVVVQEGVLAGFRGVVRELRGTRQLVIWVEAVGRGVAFTIDSALVAMRPRCGL